MEDGSQPDILYRRGHRHDPEEFKSQAIKEAM